MDTLAYMLLCKKGSRNVTFILLRKAATIF